MPITPWWQLQTACFVWPKATDFDITAKKEVEAVNIWFFFFFLLDYVWILINCWNSCQLFFWRSTRLITGLMFQYETRPCAWSSGSGVGDLQWVYSELILLTTSAQTFSTTQHHAGWPLMCSLTTLSSRSSLSIIRRVSPLLSSSNFLSASPPPPLSATLGPPLAT